MLRFCREACGLLSTKGAHGVCREWYSSTTEVILGRSSAVEGFPVTSTSLHHHRDCQRRDVGSALVAGPGTRVAGSITPSNRHRDVWVLIWIVASLYHEGPKCNVAGQVQKARIQNLKSDVVQRKITGRKPKVRRGWWKRKGNNTYPIWPSAVDIITSRPIIIFFFTSATVVL